MTIIGEKLNSSIPNTLKIMNENNESLLISLIKDQEKNGADFLDVNTAICGEDELDKLQWIIKLIIENSACGIMIDSTNPIVIKKALEFTKNRTVIINSVTLSERIDELLPIIKQTEAGIVALPIDKDGIPKTIESRIDKARLLIDKITAFGINQGSIYLDILAETLSTDDNNALLCLNTITAIKKLYPKVNTICGLSNISFGLPKRININIAFLSAAVINGLDSVILDITSTPIKTAILSSLAVAGRDFYCLDYIRYTREIDNS
ncbi:MAG: Pterin binding enzyme [Clostridia bacterium]|nr:Pterin binding enzyme [Clostridia bacterium]